MTLLYIVDGVTKALNWEVSVSCWFYFDLSV